MQQLKEALDEDDAILVATVYGVTAEGNGEHANILNRLNSQQVLADDARLEKIRKKLLTVRNQRNRPARDDKILADWNGLAIEAICAAAFPHHTPRRVEALPMADRCKVRRQQLICVKKASVRYR
jgi:uncharacterized protein YyaL (SSP411 family)